MVERRSIGSRILSMLLAVCLLVSMVPSTALSVFAADSATVTNVNTIRDYAESLLNSNFSKAASEDADSKNDKFTWDTEGKTTNWRYYNGVMLDALLMLGVDSSAGNALEFAKDFMDTNTEDASKAVTHYITKEVDSVPPALVLFDLLNTAEVTDADQAIYAKAINYVYGQLEAQTSYDQCGGNLLHKMDNDSWATWNIGLDGIYMAQPFYMEYANALAQGKITNTVNAKTASDIYKEVYDRLMWVADNMYDSTTGLYHHGWDVANSVGNGHFWSRGIGWYAAGLVMCIDLMPEGQYKTDLIAKAVKVFDGMLPYQDASGLWYNVVNRNSSLTANNGNKLEASGTALMAYAMMKAYNEEWVTDSKYATAAEKGFNGIVSAMQDGKIVNIYKSSGVCTNDDDYCKNAYVSDEAKGVGPVLMAASEVSKYADVEEEFNIGVVVAPEMTVAEGTTQLTDTSGIKATLVSNHGTVANGVASSLTYNVGSASNGKATVTVKNGDYTIDTFQVNVVNTSGTQKDSGTIAVPTQATDTPTAPSVTKDGWVRISAGGNGTGKEYTVITTPSENQNYLIAQTGNKYTLNWTGSSWAAGEISGYNSAVDGIYTISGTICHWKWDDAGYFYTTVDGKDYYIYYTGTGSNNVSATTDSAQATVFTVAKSTDSVVHINGVVGGKTRYLQVASKAAQHNSGEKDITLFQQVQGGSAEYASLNGTATYAYAVGAATNDNIIAQIKSDYTVQSATDANGTGASNVDWSNVTLDWDTDLNANSAGTYTATVIYGTKTLGSIPVLIYGDTVDVTYDVDLAVSPSALLLNTNSGSGYLTVTSDVKNSSGTSVGTVGTGYTVTSDNTDVITVNGTYYTVVGAGEANITVTADTAYLWADSSKTYAVSNASVTIPVIVTEVITEEPVTHSLVSAVAAPSTIEVGDTATIVPYAVASDGSAGYTYGFNYWISSGGEFASLNGNVLTANAIGTVVVGVTLNSVNGGYYNDTKYVTVTIVEASGEEPEETTEPAEPTEDEEVTATGVLNKTSVTITKEYGAEDPTTVDSSYLEGLTMTVSYSDGTASKTVQLADLLIGGIKSHTSLGKYIDVDYEDSVTDTKVHCYILVTIEEEEEPTTPDSDDGLTYALVESIEDGKEYVLVAVSDGKVYALKNTSTTDNSKINAEMYEITDYAADMSTITFGSADAADLSEWLFTKISDTPTYNASNYLHWLRYDGSMLHGSTKATIGVTATSNKGQFYVSLENSTNYMGISGGAWNRKVSPAQVIYIYAKSTTPSVTYTATITPESTSMTVNDSQTLTAGLTASNGAVTGTVTYAWSVVSGDATISDAGVLTAGETAGSVVVKVVAKVDGAEVDDATVTITTNAWEDTWTPKTTGSVTANAGDKLIFTISGDVAASDWGWMDNLVIYKDGAAVATVNMDNYSTANWALENFSMANEAADWKNNNTPGMSLYCADTDSNGSAVYTYTVTESGTYHFGYDIIGSDNVVNLTSTATVVKPVYTYTLYAPNGSTITNFQQFNIGVGDVWQPTFKVTRDGVDVTGEYTLVLGTQDNASIVTLTGDKARGTTNGTANLHSIAIQDADGNTVHDFSANGPVAALYVYEADHEIDCSAGITKEYKDYQLSDTVQTWTFTVESIASLAGEYQNYYNALVQILTGNVYETTIRADSYAWLGTEVSDALEPYSESGVPSDWAAWLEACKAGTQGKVTAQLVNGNAVVAIEVNGLRTTYIVPLSEGDSHTLRLTGEFAFLDNITTSSDHIDISDAVESLDTSTPAANEFVIANEMVNGKQYLFSNKNNRERAAYWDGDSWATGTITCTEVDGKDNTYTIESTTGYTLFTWEATGTNTGYFYTVVNGNKLYLTNADELTATSTSDATEFTVDLSAYTIAGDGQWLKVDSGALAGKGSEDASMLLYTPASSGGSTDPEIPEIVSFALGVTQVTISESDIDDKGYVSLDALKAAIRAANGSDKDTVTLTWTYSDGTTGSAELVLGAGQNIPLLVAEHSNGARYFGVWYNELGYTGEIGVTVETAGTTDSGFVLDTSGSVDLNDGEYIIVAKDGDKYYALQGGSSTPVEVTVTDGKVNISYADAANILWVFDETYIYNESTGKYIRNDGAPSKGGTGDKNSTVTVVDASTGAYGINLEGSGRYLYYNGEEFTRAGSSDGVQTVYLYKWSGTESGETVVTPVSATVSPGTVNVANSGTVDLSGVTMEVTMSDGSKKTVENSKLTYDVSGINTAVGKTHTVPVSYTENGKTVTANVTVVVAEASSGGTTTSEKYIHDFTESGTTDPDNFYTFTLNGTKNGLSVAYGDLTLTDSIKMNSKSSVSFDTTDDGTGTLTLVFNPDNAGNKIAIDGGDAITIPSNGVVTITGVSAGAHTVARTSGESHLMYLAFTPDITDGLKVTAPGTMYIAGTSGLYPTHNLQYTVMHNDQTVTSGFDIVWSVLDSNVATVTDGVITANNPGTTSVTAKVTMSNGTEYTDTVLVTVMGPAVESTEEMSLIHGVAGSNSGTITSTVYAGGIAEKFTLGYKSSDESVATVNESGVVTTVGKGQATIYTYIKTVNGHTVYNGDGTNPQPPYFDSTVVSVTAREVSDARLNSYDYVIEKAESANDASKLTAALTYKEDVSVEGGITAEEGLILSIVFNTGEKRTVHYGDPGLTVDYSGVDFSDPSVQTAMVVYEDPTTGEELFRDTIWVHVEGFNPTVYDGIVTLEDGVHYILDTNGIDANEEYVIVAGDAAIALKNPSATSTASGSAAGASVTLANGNVIGLVGNNKDKVLFSGVDYLTVSDSDEPNVAWLLDTFVETGTEGLVQINASNLLRYLGGTSEAQILHPNVAHVYLETVSEADGEYRVILGYGLDGTAYYLGYVNGVWTATTEATSVYLYHKYIEFIQDYGVDYELEPPAMGIPEGFVTDAIVPNIRYNNDTKVPAGDYTIVWSSDNTDVATVDQNGVVTGVKPGTATISATLYDIYGMVVVCTTHNVEYITRTVEVTVTDSNPTPVLDPDEMTIGAGTMPNFTKVAIKMTYPGTNGDFDYAVPFDQLNFKLADAYMVDGNGDPITDDEGNAIGFSNTVIGTYEVPVTYAGQNFTLTIHVVEDPYAGLDKADSIPGYPDAGSVRMNKSAQGVLDFTETGVTKIELTAAGVSTKSSVDVVLIVDVSNSMGWTTTWFEGMTADEVNDATDSQKIPTGGAGTGTDKLALAMATADEFADILLNVEGGDNTITFVTFAGADRDHGGSSDHVDSVRTPMVGIEDYATAAKVFADTKFTTLAPDGSGADYSLQIGGYVDDDGYGEESVSGTNRGNTNYDYAFGEAIDAVKDLKAKWEANNEGSYEDSGRQIHVVFMTDGAPSHYNDQRGNGNAKDTLWDGSGDNYSDLDDNSEANWLTYIKNYNELATQLKSQIDSAYTVGFDMAHGGFGSYSYELDDMQRVLEGLAKNSVVPVTMADDEEELNDYLTTLARALAYAGTVARVEDKIGGSFSLFSGTSMYSADITAGGIMSAETLAAMQAMSFPITVYSYRLVTASDVAAGTELSVILTNGSTATVVPKDEHLGLRVNEDPDILEQITFSADGTQAYSSLNPGVNIMNVNSKGERVIDAETFTYTATLDTVMHEGVETVHAKDEIIEWKIGTITDSEVSMQYYAYLDGSLDNPRSAVEGVYATNEYAYLEYIDVYGKYVKRDYGVPQVAWGKANVTVRFFLVNERGEFVNRAGVTFTNPANRIFVDGRAEYEYDLYDHVNISAADALIKAGLAGNNVLYDITSGAIVTNFAEVTDLAQVVRWSVNENLNNIQNLKIASDTSGGYGANVILDIPVIMKDQGESLRPLAPTTVVMDYGKPMEISVFSEEEMKYVTGWQDVRNGTEDPYFYDMKVVGFTAYNASFDQRDYIMATSVKEWADYTDANGTFKVLNGGNGATQIGFTPSKMLEGVETIFAVIKFSEYKIDNVYGNPVKGEATDLYYYMYKQVNIVPATVMYYETDSNMGGVFTYDGVWTLESENGASVGESQDTYVSGDVYGYDSSYNGDTGLSNGSSQKATPENTDITVLDKSNVTFTFTGTGFDIISRTGPEQGTIRVTYTNANANGDSVTVTVINKGVGELYQIPVVSVNDLPYGTHTVTIEAFEGYTADKNLSESVQNALYRGNQFYFDAIRIHNPLTGDETISKAEMVNNEYTVSQYYVGEIYAADGENVPEIKEIGKLLIDAESFNEVNDGSATGIVYLDDKGDGTTSGDNEGGFNYDDDFDPDTAPVVLDAVDTYDTIGPNHEVYLGKGQGIAFILEVSDVSALASIDVAAKTVDGTVPKLKTVIRHPSTNTSNTVETENLNSATAQYYNILKGYSGNISDLFTTSNGKTYAYVLIMNNSGSDSILSVTDLKIAFSNGSASIAVAYSEDMVLSVARFFSARFAPVTELKLAEDGNWYYYVDGEVDTGYTGLVANEHGNWYVVNGQIDFSYVGMVTEYGQKYYVRGGSVHTDTNGLEYVDGNWWYFVDGVVDTSFTGLTGNAFGTWYVEYGKINFSKVGLVEQDGKLLYVRFGQHSTNYTGLVFYVDEQEWLYVNSGAVDYTFTGLAYNSVGWWYVENGKINFQYTGLATNETGTYYVKYGQVDFTVAVEQ